MKKILKGAWDIIRDPASNSQVALAIGVIVASALVAAFVTFVYGFSVRACPSFWHSLAGGLVALMSGAASFAVGGILGLLFGAPSVSGASNQPGTAGAGAAPQGGGVRPNTSLERIADWLTTMIVGLTLVNLSVIWQRTSEASVWLTREIADDPKTLNGTPGIVIALSFGFAGFLLMYLWSLRFLPSELRQSYQLQVLANAISKLNKQLVQYAVPEAALDRQLADMKTAGVDDATLTDVRRRYLAATSTDYEAIKDFGPATLQGYSLAVKLTDAGAGFWSFVATLSASAASTGNVFWLLHNTFTPNVTTACPINVNEATYTSTANEPFWIGVVIPQQNGPAIRLAFDLGTADGADDTFRNAGSNA